MEKDPTTEVPSEVPTTINSHHNGWTSHTSGPHTTTPRTRHYDQAAA